MGRHGFDCRFRVETARIVGTKTSRANVSKDIDSSLFELFSFNLFRFNSTRRHPPGWSPCPRACLPRVEMTNQDPFPPLR